MFGNKKKIVILGSPIDHSMSPAIHNYWLKKYKISGIYKTLKTDIKDLKKTLNYLKNKGYVGANVTIPLKEKVVNFTDKVDKVVFTTKAINTLIFHKKKGIEGKNTDVYGFKKSISSIKEKKTAVIIGSGGAARAVVYGLLDLNFRQIVIINKTLSKAKKLKKDMEKLFHFKKPKIIIKNFNQLKNSLNNVSLLVNTTPLGMKGFKILKLPIKRLNKNTVVFDLIYNPLETFLLKQAKQNGNKTINGLKMLLYQAQSSFFLWFKKKPKITKELENKIKEKIK